MNSYIIGAARTPRGKGKIGKGALTGVHPQELLACVLRALPEKAGFDVRDVDDAIVGTVSQIGAQGANIARNAVLAAGWPQEVGGVSLNRFCGSGLQAINFAAMGVASGAQRLVVAGGVESMSQFGLGADGGGQDGANATLRKRVFQVPQGISADLIATLEGIARADLDAWALRSQQLAASAVEAGRFTASLIPVFEPTTGALLLEKDETIRPDTSALGLAGLSPSFAELGRRVVGSQGETLDQIALAAYPMAGEIQHVHTAGNSSGMVDGSAALAIASGDYVKAHGVRPRGRIRAIATIGSEPLIMLTAPASATLKVLRAAGMQASDIDLWEINEAFAVVVLQTIRKLGIDPDRVNVNGGSIALGHPLGATGAVLVGMALDELERRNASNALISMCIGGGQGIATIIERV